MFVYRYVKNIYRNSITKIIGNVAEKKTICTKQLTTVNTYKIFKEEKRFDEYESNFSNSFIIKTIMNKI